MQFVLPPIRKKVTFLFFLLLKGLTICDTASSLPLFGLKLLGIRYAISFILRKVHFNCFYPFFHVFGQFKV